VISRYNTRYNNILNAGCQASGASEAISGCSVPEACCLSDAVGQWMESLCTCSLSSRKAKYLRRRNRFYVRCTVGMEVAMLNGHVMRAFTLTESDYALGMGISYREAVNKFFTWLKYYFVELAYYWVEHEQGDKQRRNRHVLCYGTEKLSAVALDNEWHRVYGSKVTGLEKIWSPRGFGFYLSEYLGGEDRFVRAIMSRKWVFPGWWKFNLDYHGRYGEYPSVERLASLSEMSPEARAGALEWLIETGYGDLQEAIRCQAGE
jgi:hypothetical protein